MLRMCNCNSEFISNSDYWIHLQIMGSECQIKQSEYCDDCGNYTWFDADYENMMFDLKNMNS